MVYTVYHSICIFQRHYHIETPNRFRTIIVIVLSVQNVRTLIVVIKIILMNSCLLEQLYEECASKTIPVIVYEDESICNQPIPIPID